MEVVHDQEAFPRPARGTIVTIGQYDGVHLGHRAVISELARLAAAGDHATALVTFDRHPASVVRPLSAPLALTDLEQKLELLAETSLDYALVLRFDERRSHQRAEDFVKEVLLRRLDARAVVVGEDFHFGHRRKGNVDLLRSMGAEAGFEVVGLDLVGLADGGSGGAPISSTAIRQALSEGRLEDANLMLGRPHEVRGTVAKGDGRGRDLGYPTANVESPPGIQMPADGVYAGWYLRASGECHPAAISLGGRPTFYPRGEASLLEAHLLDFEGDLYGEPARVRFVRWLRAQQRFDSPDALIARMNEDCAAAREALG